MTRPRTATSGRAANTAAASDDGTSMIEVHLIDFAGNRHDITGNSGDSLMRAATNAQIVGIAADCGGCMTCATCHVIVDPDWAARLPPISPDEDARHCVIASPSQPTSRLSCQITLH